MHKTKMDKTNQWFTNTPAESMTATPRLSTLSDSMIHITDPRVAQLLLVLNELDESVAGLEGLPNSKLGDLVLDAILACGFVDPNDAQCAIAPILEALGIDDSMPECS